MNTAAYLAKFGWKEGQGLGKNGDGIKTYIRVSKKKDHKGVGAHPSAITRPWWETLYNAAAQGKKVDGLAPKFKQGECLNTTKPEATFAKGATMRFDKIEESPPSSCEESGESDVEDAAGEATSSATYHALGGLTGKKGDMDGKLLRIKQQDAVFLEKARKRSAHTQAHNPQSSSKRSKCSLEQACD